TPLRQRLLLSNRILNMSDISAHKSWEIFKKGSKSFSFAARIFSSEILEDTARLYYWCRYCDDVIDENIGFDQIDLEYLVKSTQQACVFSDSMLPSPFDELRHVLHTYKIPRDYPLELLEGMRMDRN